MIAHLSRVGRAVTIGAIAWLAAACTGSAASVAGPDAPEAKGPRAPDFDLTTLDGGSMSLAQHRGKVVLLDFWSTTCDPCLQEMPELVKLYREKKDQGFELLAISTDGPETISQVSSVVKAKGMIFPVLLDQNTEVLDRYNPKGELPFAVLIDRSGAVVLKRAGYQAGDVASMRSLTEAVDNALAQQ